jgi:hypothetical protein
LIDIEKELAELKAQDFKPSEDLRLNTRAKVNSAARQSGQREVARFRPGNLKAVAAVLAILLVVSVFTVVPAQAASDYYTIDINPSVSVAVDGHGNVISAAPENDDAKELLSGLNLKGMQFEKALKTIVQAAVQQQYLKEDGHLLVAHFGRNEGLTQQQLNSIVSEQIPGGNVSALMLSGDKEQYEKSKKSGQKAGIELLLSNAKEQGIDTKDVDSLIHMMSPDNTVKDKPENNIDKDNQAAAESQNPGNGNSGKNDKDVNGNSGNSQGNNGSNGTNNGSKNTAPNEDKDKQVKDKDKDNNGNNKNNSQENGGAEGQDKDSGSQGNNNSSNGSNGNNNNESQNDGGAEGQDNNGSQGKDRNN